MTTAISKRLRFARAARGLSQAQLAELSKVPQQTIARIENSWATSSKSTFKLADALGISAAWLAGEGNGEDDVIIYSESGLNMIPIDSTMGGTKVRGAVVAGTWKEAKEWPEDEWYEIPKPILKRYPSRGCYALLVQGESMNMKYLPGSHVYCIPLDSLGRELKTGDYVIVQRENEGEYETTIKQIEFETSGRVLLWPRSTHRDHQASLIIKDPKATNRSDNNIIRVIGFVVGVFDESP